MKLNDFLSQSWSAQTNVVGCAHPFGSVASDAQNFGAHCLTACGEPTVKHHNYSKLHFYKNFVRRFEGLHVHHTTTPSFCLGGEFQNRRRIIRTGTSTSKYEKKNCLSYTTSTYRGRFLFFVQQCEKNCIILHNLNGRVLI